MVYSDANDEHRIGETGLAGVVVNLQSAQAARSCNNSTDQQCWPGGVPHGPAWSHGSPYT